MFFSIAPPVVETLHALVNSGVGGAGCSVPVGLTGDSVGPVCLPRRAETFGGFDSHQMNSSKSKTNTFIHIYSLAASLPSSPSVLPLFSSLSSDGEKEEGEESLDLRRTESDSVLKKVCVLCVLVIHVYQQCH